MALRKKTRFEVFKRDSFTCQYCGVKAPDVVLELDHIEPKKESGSDDITNLITSCFDCNRGKGARTLSDNTVVEKKHAQATELQERRNQIAMMAEWHMSLVDVVDDEVDAYVVLWNTLSGGCTLTDAGRRGAARVIKKFGLGEALSALRIAHDQYVRYDNGQIDDASAENALVKVGGICYNRTLNLKEAAAKSLYYYFVRRYRDQCSDHPPRWKLWEWYHANVDGVVSEREEVAWLVAECVSVYRTESHGSYWSALASLDMVELFG